ncbi:hypothetical protein I316_07916 [Kwoniella heveanensis BCC8398]|uniref:GRIP domain-containing protein n=1 Tax=Kwoniella heveanensis BCC8398 TaxID=1296120 RepID=A0A1B9GHA6_9TREE|nr:hypothetical protein I316_07916 [Kwoniella heveanensis BCC8398]
MFGSSLQDRLNAAVKTLEATGTSLQARALSVNANPNANAAASSSSSRTGAGPQRPVSPNTAKSSQPASPIVGSISTSGAGGADNKSNAVSVSPTKTTVANNSATAHGGGGSGPAGYVNSTAHLAENALSGLRKSFHFGRSSTDLTRPTLPTAPSTSVASSSSPQQELKSITSPSSPISGSAVAAAAEHPSSSSRPASPNPRLLATPTINSSFTLGSSDPPSRASTPTPIPKSPIVGGEGRRGSRLALSPSLASSDPLSYPTPDPSDPATYPLPPSPPLSASDTLSTASLTGFVDPLGASPLLRPELESEVPQFGLQEATPEIEKKEGEVALGPDGDIGEGSSEDRAGTVHNGAGAAEAIGEIKLSAEDAKKIVDAERRYEDLSQRFTTLLTQTHNANRVLKELTPLEGGVADHEALEGWVRMMNGKVEMITAEMKRLQDKLTLQDSRMEELRDTHRLEGSSQTELISKLRSDLAEAQAKITTNNSDASTLTQLRADLTKAQTQAKEEEEKRTKAISLLKTVRLKLVKVEKEKEEIEKDRAEERAERSRAAEEVEKVKAEKEREVTQLRRGFERELASTKERYEKDLQSKKAAWELEMITTKAAHAKELSAKTTKVNGLESIVKELNLNKSKTFEDLQAKQAEAETARAEAETMQTRTKELEFQLREANERCALLEDGMRDSRRPSRAASGMGLGASSAEVQRLLSEAEARAEAKLSDLRFKIRSLETERNEIEEEWATKLGERVRELEKLRRQVQEKEMEYTESIRSIEDRERRIQDSDERARGLERELIRLKTKIEEGKGDIAVAVEAERSAREELSAVQVQIITLQSQLEESKSHITQLKTNNKTLRDELRKVQSSVQLMEKQRNPGVGYWSNSAANPSSISTGAPGAGVSRSSVSSPAPSLSVGDMKAQDEEEVNLEYLRNVILQFLEHKEMRPNLVRVMSVILRFTPQELRRLNAKLQT